MYALSDPMFWLYGMYFFLASFLALFIPGHLCIRKLRVDTFSEIVLSFVTGFVLWSLAGFLCGFLHMRNLLYPYILVCFLVWIKQKNYTLFFHLPKKIDGKIAAVIIVGVSIQLLSVFFNGIRVNKNIYFCCGVPDTIAHIALTNELTNRFPPENPGFHTIALHNYHYLSHLAQADLIRIFTLPLISTQYQYMTIVFSVLLGLTGVTLAKALRLNKRFMFWLVCFIYFFGDIIFLLPFITGKGFQFSLTTLENASTLWVSPPRVFALVILMTGLTLFVYWLKKKDIYIGIIMALLISSLVGIKAYIGIFAISGFFFLGLYYLITKKYTATFPLIFIAVFSCILWVTVNKDAGGLVYTGFWRFEDFIVQPVLGLSHLELARRIFLDNHNLIRAFSYDLLFAFLYIVFSSGALLLGIFQTKESIKALPKELHIVLITGLITTCIAGFFFLQTTGGANSSQFLISLYIVGAIYASLAIAYRTRTLPFLPLVITSALIIFFTSTRVIHYTYAHIQRMLDNIGIVLSPELLGAYQYFAETEKNSVVFVSNDSTTDCLFITFIGKRTTHTCMSGLPAAIPDTVLAEKAKERQTILFGKDMSAIIDILEKNNITHIFIPKKDIGETTIPLLHFPLVYETDTIAIYKTSPL